MIPTRFLGLAFLGLAALACSDDEPEPGGTGASGAGASGGDGSSSSSVASTGTGAVGPGGSGPGGAGPGGAGPGGAGPGGAGGSGGAPAGGAGGVGGSGGSGGNNGDGNDDLASATPLVPGGDGVITVDAELVPIDSDVDFYSFTAPAGLVVIQIDAKPSFIEFDPAYPDTVVTLYDDQQQVIARNDDPFPRDSQDSQLITVLPAAGTYYVKVEEYCGYSATDLGTTCPDEAIYYGTITEPAYQLFILPEDALPTPPPVETPEPNDTLATAAQQFYTDLGGFYATVFGSSEFTDPADVDGFKFTVPTNIALSGMSGLQVQIVVPPPGIDPITGVGDGASRFAGFLELVDPDTDTTYARVNVDEQSNPFSYRLIDAPVEPGKEYLLRVGAGFDAPAPTLGPFQVFRHVVRDFGAYIEENDALNDSVATPETLFDIGGGVPFFSVQANLAAGDIADDFLISTGGFATLRVFCRGRNDGSGLVDLQADVRPLGGGASLGSGTEGTFEPLDQSIDVSGFQDLVVRMTAGGQDPDVTGSYYWCAYQLQ